MEVQQSETYYGAPKIQGIIALERKRVILEQELSPGDFVIVSSTPDGKLLIAKCDSSTIQIERVECGYISFTAPIQTKGV